VRIYSENWFISGEAAVTNVSAPSRADERRYSLHRPLRGMLYKSPAAVTLQTNRAMFKIT